MSQNNKDILKRVVPRENIPTPLLAPLIPSAVIWLYLDKYRAPGWLIGVVFTLLAIWFVGVAIIFFNQKERPIVFEEDLKVEDTGAWSYKKMWNRGKMQ